jgi:hypothetical protein
LIRIAHAIHLHAWRAHGHAGRGNTQEIVTLAQGHYLIGRYVTFDEFAVYQTGMARRQTRWHAVLLLEFAHVAFDMVLDLEAVGLQVADPFFAATAIGVAMDFDRDQVGGLGQGGDQQGAQGSQTQRVSHGKWVSSCGQRKAF